MDSYCVFGHPIEHSKSPWIQTRFAELTGQTLQYEKTWVPLDAFKTTIHAFRAAGGKGCNVTLPFKTEAAALATECSPRVALAQACNTLKFEGENIYGENTDGLGLVNDLVKNAGFSLQGRHILLIGAGGASAGVLGPLMSHQPHCIWVANRSVDKAICRGSTRSPGGRCTERFRRGKSCFRRRYHFSRGGICLCAAIHG